MSYAAAYDRLVAHPDPLARASNAVALIVAASQPFYPVYVWWIAGPAAWPTLFTLLTTPFFLAVPFLSRRDALAGRALLPLAGIANTTMTALLMPPGTGVLLFLGPVLMIATLQFRRGETWLGLSLAALAGVAFFAVGALDPSGIAAMPADALARLLTLNAVSAGSLVVIAGLQFSAARDGRP